MPATSDRAGIKRKIVEVLDEHGPGQLAASSAGEVPLVTYNDPTADQLAHNEFVIVGRITGEQTAATLSTSDTGRNDSFTIECFVGVMQQGDDEQAADARCQMIIDSLGATLFASPRLDRSSTNEPAMQAAALYPGRLDGPNSSPTDGSSVVSGAFVNIEVQVALRGS